MRVLKIVLGAILALALILVVVAPIGPMPGVFIGGTPTDVPEKWRDTSQVDEIMLKVPGAIPRVVIIWVIEHGGELHVVGSKNSGWVKMIGSGSPVQMRIEDDTYSLKATPVTDGWERVLQAYLAKYEPGYPEIVAGFPSIDEAADLVAVYRLDRS